MRSVLSFWFAFLKYFLISGRLGRFAYRSVMKVANIISDASSCPSKYVTNFRWFLFFGLAFLSSVSSSSVSSWYSKPISSRAAM
jgi:hypothetical protein